MGALGPTTQNRGVSGFRQPFTAAMPPAMPAPLRHLPHLIHLADWADLPEGTARGFDPHGQGSDTVILVRYQGRVHGWRNVCPHQHIPLEWRKDAFLNPAADRLVCAAHGAQFAIDSGLCTLGPCLGQGLEPVPLHIGPDGAIYLAPAQDEPKT